MRRIIKNANKPSTQNGALPPTKEILSDAPDQCVADDPLSDEANRNGALLCGKPLLDLFCRQMGQLAASPVPIRNRDNQSCKALRDVAAAIPAADH